MLDRRRFLAACAGLGRALVFAAGPAAATPAGGRSVWHDPLTAHAPAAVAAARDNRGGEFTAAGWRMVATKGFLRIDLPQPAPREGELQVTITGLDWAAVGRAVGADRKIHFLNLFSNPRGDHHAEGGGTAEDALWTLRAGTDEAGAPRYGAALKLLWASRGAKRTPGSDYHEKQLAPPVGWSWDPRAAYRFAVRWSARTRTLSVEVDGTAFGTVPWRRDGAPLRYVFLGGAADFHALAGAVFSDLRIGDTSGRGG